MLRCNSLISITDEQIANGFAKAVNPARLELLSEKPIVLLDGAHNPNGIEALKSAIQKFLPNKYIIAITGMLADKDVSTSVKLLDGVLTEFTQFPFTIQGQCTLQSLCNSMQDLLTILLPLKVPNTHLIWLLNRLKRPIVQL